MTTNSKNNCGISYNKPVWTRNWAEKTANEHVVVVVVGPGRTRLLKFVGYDHYDIIFK